MYVSEARPLGRVSFAGGAFHARATLPDARASDTPGSDDYRLVYAGKR